MPRKNTATKPRGQPLRATTPPPLKAAPPPKRGLLEKIRGVVEAKQWREPTRIRTYDDDFGCTASTYTWNAWNTQITTAATAATNTWYGWNDCTTGGTADTWTCDNGIFRQTWNGWITADATGTQIRKAAWNTWVAQAPAVHIRQHLPALTPEEQLAREQRAAQLAAENAERQRQWREEDAKRLAERKIINDRAEALLLSLMNEQQRKDWIGSGHFFLHVGDRKYRIRRGSHGNVDLVDEKNKVLENFCCLPSKDVPEADCVAGQLLSLRFDEEAFIKTANANKHRTDHVPLREQIRQGTFRRAA